MAFSLGSITGLIVSTWEGFDFPEKAAVQDLLGDGSSDTLNALIQGGALGFARAGISGTLTNSTDLGNMRTYFQAKTTQTFTDDTGATFSVNVCVVLEIGRAHV